MNYRTLEVQKDPQCPTCSGKQTELLADYELFCGITAAVTAGASISVIELKSMIDNGEEFDLVDVREPGEFEIVHISGSRLVPQAEILSGRALATFSPQRKVVLYCKTGVRSAACQSVLEGAGFQALNLTGGVTAWAQQIDTSLPLY